MEEQKGNVWTRVLKWFIYAVFVLSIIGAVPQYITWITSYILNVPSDHVYRAVEQNQLWDKNIDCYGKLPYSIIKTDTNLVLKIWVCTSGDILVAEEKPDGQVFYRWISFTTRRITNYIIPDMNKAFAEERYLYSDMLVAQSDIEVLCQRRRPDGSILRRSRLADGRCVDEIINPYTGRVVDRRQVSCDSSCL